MSAPTTPLLSASEARRTALWAQLLDRPPRSGPVGTRRVSSVLERLQVLQVDSVNVLARAHLMPLYSRLGDYPVAVLERIWNRAPRTWTEYWAHEASLVPAGLRPALITVQRRKWMTAHAMEPTLRQELSARILEMMHSVGRPMTARQVEARIGHAGRQHGHWGWNWTAVKRVLEDLFVSGELASAGRTAQFERRYGVAERLLPAEALAPGSSPDAGSPGRIPGEAPEQDSVHRQARAAVPLMRAASAALGVATLGSLADYYRIHVRTARTAVEHLVGTGELEPVRIRTTAGRASPAWRHAAATTPRRATGRALVNPFDPLVFHRKRVEELFGVRYRLGIYTPEPRRTRGYYPLLFLLGEHLCAQVDLKAERAASVLSVRGAWSEVPTSAEDSSPAVAPAGRRASDVTPSTGEVIGELAAELGELAGWLKLHEVRVEPAAPGELTAGLARSLRNLSGSTP